MNRSAVVTGFTLVLLGLAVFAWKVWGFGLPVLPGDPEGVWRVELAVTLRGSGDRGSVRAPLPSSGPGQIVYDERTVADRLRFAIRTEEAQRNGVWQGRLRGVHELAYGFRVQLVESRFAVPEEPVTIPREIERRFLRAAPEFPSEAPEIAEVLANLSLPPPEDPAGRMRTVFAMVTHEVATVDGATEDALLTLASRQGGERGKTALLVSLLRAAGVPARPVVGLHLRPGDPVRERTWTEAWAGGTWVPMSASEGFFAVRPKHLLVLQTGSFEGVEATGADAVAHRYYALREHLRSDELAAMMVPPNRLFAELSLYRLPVATQQALRALLLLPVGALVVALFRNLIGFSTYGTFMPILIALALRDVPLSVGVGLVVGVIGVGVLGRLVLDRLRLLLVPRLSVLLCLVVFGVVALALAGRWFEARNLAAGVLFPMVILTMLVERFSISIAEEGMRKALVRAGNSLVVTAAVYPIFRSHVAEHLMFSFPELVFSIMGALVLIGAYTGYRITDLLRFRSFAKPLPEAT